jgi:hypothetical protein
MHLCWIKEMPGSSLFSTPEARPVSPRWWPTLLATAFVILCLLALALVPIWAASRIDGLRTEIEVVAQPTHPLATRLQFMYARQAASVRSYLLANDPSALARYRDARAHEQEILYQLDPLTERLNPMLPPQLLSRNTKIYAVGGHQDLRTHRGRYFRFRGERARRSRARSPLKQAL